MRTKYFFPNEEGNIEFTREELEKLLNDVFDEGVSVGLNIHSPLHYFEPSTTPCTPIYNTKTTTPYVPTIYCTDDDSIGRIVLDKVKDIGQSTTYGDIKDEQRNK